MRSPFILGIYAAIAVSTIVSAQTPGPIQCRFPEAFNPLGWPIPGLTEATLNQPGESFQQDGVDDLHSESLDPHKAKTKILAASCDSQHAGRLVFQKILLEVRSITRYRRGDKLFGYRVVADVVVVEGGKWIPVGSTEMLTYYDVDGSGKFKLRKAEALFTLGIPDWVKQLGGPALAR